MIATVACGLLAVACAVAVTLDACTRPPRIDPAAVLDEFARLTLLELAHAAASCAAAHAYDDMLTRGLLEQSGPAVPDPGNPGAVLRLTCDTHGAITQRGGRVLLAVNPADGLTVALPVPPYVDDPVEAAAWSYDVDRDTYLTLARRT
jgi:hypothetical protein